MRSIGAQGLLQAGYTQGLRGSSRARAGRNYSQQGLLLRAAQAKELQSTSALKRWQSGWWYALGLRALVVPPQPLLVPVQVAQHALCAAQAQRACHLARGQCA
jgi:hypothetical protein